MEQRYWHVQPRWLAAVESDAADPGGGAPAAAPADADAHDALESASPSSCSTTRRCAPT